jgi:fumarate reductase flavoprotein subunit
VQHEFDVIVVGGGGSGLAAAASAAECGAEVLLLEKRPHLGGTTGIAVGSFTAAGTQLQRAAGIEDDVAAHAEDAARFAPAEIEARNNEPLRRYFLAQAAETLDWLTGMGLRFHGPSPEPPNRAARMHNVVPGAQAYLFALQARLLRHGGVIRTGATVQELLREGGAVVGVAAMVAGQPVEFRSRRGVVLAAGDYASSAETISRFKGRRFASIEGVNPHATGDGHRLAEAAGARLLNMDVTYGPELRFVAPAKKSLQQRLPSRGVGAWLLGRLLPLVPRRVLDAFVRRLLVTWQHPENALFDDGAILVNREGRRFCNEAAWPEREIGVAEQPGQVGYILLDVRLIERYSRWPHYVSTAPQIAYAFVADYLRLRPDVAVEAHSPTELARRRGLPPEVLEASVAAYNETDCGDRPRLAGGRWVLLGPVKAYFTTTEGGAAIDEQFRVLDAEKRPIPNLYAVGQNGLGGQVLWGHGLHIAWAITSGRLVGRLFAGLQRPGHSADA